MQETVFAYRYGFIGAGAMAEAYYGMPESLKDKIRQYLPEDLADVLLRFSCHISI